MAHLKENRPDLWAELQRQDNVQRRVTKGYKYGETFAQVARRVEQWIRNRDLTEQQLFPGRRPGRNQGQGNPVRHDDL